MSRSRAMLLVLAGLCGASAAAGAVEVMSTGGSACQPTTPADAALVAYRDGAATAAHGTASVSCALTAAMPGHRQVGAAVMFASDTRDWRKSRCVFFNAFPSRSLEVRVVGIPGREHIGVAEFPADKAGFAAASAVCTLHPQQKLYGIDAYLEPH